MYQHKLLFFIILYMSFSPTQAMESTEDFAKELNFLKPRIELTTKEYLDAAKKVIELVHLQEKLVAATRGIFNARHIMMQQAKKDFSITMDELDQILKTDPDLIDKALLAKKISTLKQCKADLGIMRMMSRRKSITDAHSAARNVWAEILKLTNDRAPRKQKTASKKEVPPNLQQFIAQFGLYEELKFIIRLAAHVRMGVYADKKDQEIELGQVMNMGKNLWDYFYNVDSLYADLTALRSAHLFMKEIDFITQEFEKEKTKFMPYILKLEHEIELLQKKYDHLQETNAQTMYQLLLEEEEQKTKLKKEKNKPKKTKTKSNQSKKPLQSNVTTKLKKVPSLPSTEHPDDALDLSGFTLVQSAHKKTKEKNTYTSWHDVDLTFHETDDSLSISTFKDYSFVFYKIGPCRSPVKFMFDQRVSRWCDDPEAAKDMYKKEKRFKYIDDRLVIKHSVPTKLISYTDKIGYCVHTRPNQTHPEYSDTVYSFPCHIEYGRFRFIGALEAAVSGEDGLCYHWYITSKPANSAVKDLISQGYWQWLSCNQESK